MRRVDFEQGPTSVQVAGHQIGGKNLHFSVAIWRHHVAFIVNRAQLNSRQRLADVTVAAENFLGPRSDEQSLG